MGEIATIEGLIKIAMEARLLDVHTSTVGIVDAVGSTTVDITIPINRVNKDGTNFTLPVLPDVPVMFLGNASLSIAHSISKGDEGIVLFMERDISSFVENGNISRPTQLRKHEYSDAVFIPISISKGKRVQIPSSGIEIKGDVKIEGDLDSTGEVTANSGTPAMVSLSTHMHPTAAVGPPSSPTPGT